MCRLVPYPPQAAPVVAGRNGERRQSAYIDSDGLRLLRLHRETGAETIVPPGR